MFLATEVIFCVLYCKVAGSVLLRHATLNFSLVFSHLEVSTGILPAYEHCPWPGPHPGQASPHYLHLATCPVPVQGIIQATVPIQGIIQATVHEQRILYASGSVQGLIEAAGCIMGYYRHLDFTVALYRGFYRPLAMYRGYYTTTGPWPSTCGHLPGGKSHCL